MVSFCSLDGDIHTGTNAQGGVLPAYKAQPDTFSRHCRTLIYLVKKEELDD